MSNSARRDTPLSHRGRVTNDDRPYHDFGKQYSNNQRQKRSAPLADEDLFEFMVRIANTPAEWERIRRVLSLIKPAQPKSVEPNVSTSTSLQNRTTTKDHVSHANPAKNSTKTQRVSANSQPSDTWPSNDWIRKIVDPGKAKKVDFVDEDEYFEPEEDEDEDDEDDEDDDSTNTDIYTFEQRKPVTNETTKLVCKDESSRMIIPNEKLPNFVYKRVKPAKTDSDDAQNSAYIAVSVVSPPSASRQQYPEPVTTTTTTTTTTTNRPAVVMPELTDWSPEFRRALYEMHLFKQRRYPRTLRHRGT